MRTTLTIDDDVASMLDTVRSAKKLTLRDAINQALRVGLAQALERKPPEHHYKARLLEASGCRLPNLDKISEILASAEGDHYA
jgi:hypothetical protein